MTDEAGLVEQLRDELGEVAAVATVPMELWDRFSNRVLQAAARITALEGERDEQTRLADERSERMGELYRRSDRAVSRALAAEAALSRQAGQRVTLDRDVVETLFRDALHMGAVLVDEPFPQRVDAYSTETRLFTDRLLALLPRDGGEK